MNKAHSAALNRLLKLYGGTHVPGEHPDICAPQFDIEVETTATLQGALRRLKRASRPTYLAMTNQNGVQAALKLVDGSPLGIMDPQGRILRETK